MWDIRYCDIYLNIKEKSEWKKRNVLYNTICFYLRKQWMPDIEYSDSAILSYKKYSFFKDWEYTYHYNGGKQLLNKVTESEMTADLMTGWWGPFKYFFDLKSRKNITEDFLKEIPSDNESIIEWMQKKTGAEENECSLLLKFLSCVYTAGNIIPSPINWKGEGLDSWPDKLSKIMSDDMKCSELWNFYIQKVYSGNNKKEKFCSFVESNYLGMYFINDSLGEHLLEQVWKENKKLSERTKKEWGDYFKMITEKINERSKIINVCFEIDDYFKMVEFDYKELKKSDFDKTKNMEETLRYLYEKTKGIEENVSEKSAYEKWNDWKYSSKKDIDPDDSNFNRPNKFMRVIYYILWGKRINEGEQYLNEKGQKIGIYENGWGNFRTSYIYDGCNAYLWGGETINTIASYKGKDLEKLLNPLCERSHQVGNFVLVPAYFNQWKGTNEKANDRMDRALDELKNRTDGYNLYKGARNMLKSSKGVSKCEKCEKVREKFADFDKKDFNSYINVFFLWDYVIVDKGNNEYKIKNMWVKGEEELKSDEDKKDTDVYIKNYIEKASSFIQRRNIFIAAMLYIAIELEEDKDNTDDKWKEWKEWKVSKAYKIIVQEVFQKNDKLFSSYEKVIEKIITVIKKSEIKEDEKKEIQLILEETNSKIRGTNHDIF